MFDKSELFYIIKLKDQATAMDVFRSYLNASINPGTPVAYYNLTANTSKHDAELFRDMPTGECFRCAVLDYRDDKINCIYWCECSKYDAAQQSIHCRLIFKTSDNAIIDNFIYNLHLNLEKDFPANSYLNYEISQALITQMFKFESSPFSQETTHKTYAKLESESNLSPLAQRNEYCIRKYNLRVPQQRGEYQRDYDRIISSKSFRRMVDKAQIFSSTKGDHYRTRMTHTLIVCDIARGICNTLKLNSPLAEAISLGHDLGHTPFGHQGERTLNNILTGQTGFDVEHLSLTSDDPKAEKEQLFPFGGFKHNYQSVRAACVLESQYPEIDGLDLTKQTLDGMWMHTGKKSGLDIGTFSDGFLEDGGRYAFTLEGQVVAVADEIAQRSHDVEDAFTSHLISPEELIQYLSLKKSTELKEKIADLLKSIQTLEEKHRLFSDKNELIYAQISSIIIDHFIKDVCEETRKRMYTYNVDQFNKDNHRVDERLVWFSNVGEDLCKYLENIISKKVINSHEVTLFDQNGSNIVLALFRAYYKNPMLLHKGTLQRIWNDYRKATFKVVSFEEGKPQAIKSEWEKITTMNIPADERKRDVLQNEYLTKRIILVRGICDFISGMTDSYAMNQYHKIIF